MFDKELESLACKLNDLDSLVKLFAHLNFTFGRYKPVDKDTWNQEEKDLVEEALIIAFKGDYRVFYIRTKTDLVNKWKNISTKIIKVNNGQCIVCSHNPNGFKWIFSSLSKNFSKSFTEARHIPIDIQPSTSVPKTFVEFLENIKLDRNDSTISISTKISDAFDTFAIKIHDELTENVFNALKILSEGIIEEEKNNLILDDSTLEEIREPIFILLYRIIFILYAEDREIFPIEQQVYNKEFSFKWLKKEWLLDEDYKNEIKEYEVQKRLWRFFELVELGSENLGYNHKEFFMKPYYGRLFDRQINSKINNWKIKNTYLLNAIKLLTQTHDNRGNNFFLDYSALETRHLGSIYEHLLEYHLVIDGKKIAALPNARDRKMSGSYYTPQHIVDYIVKNSIGPLIDNIIKKNNNTVEQIEKILELNILDPAMGSGHFLIGATNYIANRICELECKKEIPEQRFVERKRDVVRRCVYGVDLNPLAVDLAQVSLWLETLSSEKPLSFLRAHLRSGNSLIGASINDILDKQTTLIESLKGSRTHFKKIVKDFIMLENLEDDTSAAVKAKDEKYTSMQSEGIYHNLKILLNAKLSKHFGVDIPPLGDYIQKIGENSLDFHVEDSPWKNIEEIAQEHSFFHWDLEFLDIFYDQNGERKKNPGFDVIIGNPPYITTRKISKKERVVFWKKYEKFLINEINTFTLFYAKIDELIRGKGIWGFITPSGWYTNDPYKKLRKWLFVNNQILTIVDFPYRFFPFDCVNTETSIVIGKKFFKKNNVIKILKGTRKILRKMNEITDDLLENTIAQKSIIEISKFKLYLYQTEISIKLNKINHKFGEIIVVHNPSSLDRRTKYPTTTKKYNKCVFSRSEIRKDLKLNKICRPCLVGEDIQRYFCRKTEKFTNIKWNENGNEKQLNSKTLEWMNQAKIVGQRITGQASRRMVFSIELTHKITMPSANIILLKNSSLVHDEKIKILYYLQALLNSKLINYFYETQYGEANTNITSSVIEEFPLIMDYNQLWKKSKKLSQLYVIKNEQNHPVTNEIVKLEKEIDHKIYHLCELDPVEISLVENYYQDQ